MQKGIFITDYSAERIMYFKTHRSVDSLHYEKACIGYLVKGNAEYLCEGKKYSLKEGDLIFIPRKSTCVSIWEGSPDIVFYSVNFDYRYGEGIERFGIQVLDGIEESLLENMVKTIEGRYIKSIGYFYLFLDELFCRLKRDDSEMANAVRPAIQHLKENFTSRVYVSELAKLCNLSVSNLYVYFKSEIGCTPIEYKNNLLVQKAIDLLLNSGLTVEETSERLGVLSLPYFRKLFKKFTGKLPKDFKK